MRSAQRHLGQQRIAWLFLAPNLIIFGLFTFLPIILNFVYATTGGVRSCSATGPGSGRDNFKTLLACQNYLDPTTCAEGPVLAGGLQHRRASSSSRSASWCCFALVTALVLNREIRARGFFRSVFFYPVLLSPVVVALIWKWILQRDGMLNAWIDRARRRADA